MANFSNIVSSILVLVVVIAVALALIRLVADNWGYLLVIALGVVGGAIVYNKSR